MTQKMKKKKRKKKNEEQRSLALLANLFSPRDEAAWLAGWLADDVMEHVPRDNDVEMKGNE